LNESENNTPKGAENADEQWYKSKHRPTKHLPDGWKRRDFDDGSGGLLTPEGNSVISYDLQTKEYKVDGKWHYMGDEGIDMEYLEKLAFAKYVQLATANEALSASLSQKGYIDMGYMSSLTRFSYDKLLSDLEGVVFLNIGSASDQTKTYVTADEYLSGNIKEKLMQAKAAQATINDGSFDVNVTALEAAMQQNETQKNQNNKERVNMSKFDIQARVNPLTDQTKPTKAMASVTIDDVIAINNLTIVEANKSLFVGYPQNRDSEGGYRDIVEFLRDKDDKMLPEAVELKDAIQKKLVEMFKNGERATPDKAEADKKPVDHEIKAYVTPLPNSETSTRGLGTVQVGELFKINSVRVNENTKEGSENFGKLYVAMPARPDSRIEGGYKDVVHPVNKEFGEKLRGAVLKRYENQLSWNEKAAGKDKPDQQREKPPTNRSADERG
jgi:DNA-binding cell septation regulator SpoVG